MKLKDTPAGWVVDPAGESFDVLGESPSFVRLKHPTHGLIIAIPKAALPPPEKKKEPASGVQGKGGQ